MGERVQVAQWDILDLIERMDKPGVLIFVDPPYLPEVRAKSLNVYVHDEFDHDAFISAVSEAKHASFAITHYPCPQYDAAFGQFEDYLSYRNVPDGEGRSERTERLYIVDRSPVVMKMAS